MRNRVAMLGKQVLDGKLGVRHFSVGSDPIVMMNRVINRVEVLGLKLPGVRNFFVGSDPDAEDVPDEKKKKELELDLRELVLDRREEKLMELKASLEKQQRDFLYEKGESLRAAAERIAEGVFGKPENRPTLHNLDEELLDNSSLTPEQLLEFQKAASLADKEHNDRRERALETFTPKYLHVDTEVHKYTKDTKDFRESLAYGESLRLDGSPDVEPDTFVNRHATTEKVRTI